VRKTIINSPCGYSFVELLVAVAILGLVAAPLFSLFNGSFASIFEAGIRSAAVNLAREKMETVKARSFEEVYAFYVTGPGSPAYIEEDISGHPHFKRVTEVALLNPEPELLPSGTELLTIKVTVYRASPRNLVSESLESRLAKR